MVVVEVLGPVQVRRDDGTVVRPPGLQALLLSMLVVDADQIVTTDRLIDVMWGAAPDDRAAHRLQSHIHRLRRTLDTGATIEADGGGYRLSLEGGAVDAVRFEKLLAEARRAAEIGDHDQVVTLCRDALSLWRGAPFETIETTRLAGASRRLHDLRSSTWELLLASELSRGNHETVAREIEPLVREHPLRERLHELLVTALSLSGHHADALGACERARTWLLDELGVEPGPRLRELHRMVLAEEAILVDPGTSVPKPSRQVPAQLPVCPRVFVGRTDVLRELDEGRSRAVDPVRIFCLTGGAGTGKTALAVSWGHAVTGDFPDGQLYIDLRGFGPDEPRVPTEALPGLLTALGVPTAEIPDGEHERSALFRSAMSGRRMLVVLDNAKDADHVRPLLPGTSESVTVVTSRSQLTGLVVQEGAHRLPLGPLSPEETQQLIADLGLPLDDSQADSLAAVCSRLPLALCIAAERMRSGGAQELDALLASPQDVPPDAGTRLDVLDVGEDRASVRGVFSWSYRHLDHDSAWIFRCFGISPSAELSLGPLSALAHLDERATRRGVETLRRAHLVEPVSRGRYRLHDLLRVYAIELSENHDPESARQRAFARLCDHYLERAALAMVVRMPHQTDHPSIQDLAGRAKATGADVDVRSAITWLTTERENLVLTSEEAARRGGHTFSTDLSEIIWRDLYHDEAHVLAERLHGAALRAARHVDDASGEGTAHRRLAITAVNRARLDEAQHHAARALELHATADALKEIAADRDTLGALSFYRCRPADAGAHFESSAHAHEELADPRGGCAMANAGLVHQRMGRLDDALFWLGKALDYSRQHHQTSDECSACASLSLVHRERGELETSLRCAEQAIALAQDIAAADLEGFARAEMGKTSWLSGETATGQHLLDQALDVAERLVIEDLASEARFGLGAIALDRGDLHRAVGLFSAALDVSDQYWYELAQAHRGLARTFDALGSVDEATEARRRAAEIYTAVDHPDAEALRRRAAGGPAP